MRRKHDKQALLNQIRELLGEQAQVGAAILKANLGIGQSVLSRMLAGIKSELLVTGKAQATRYSMLRRFEDVPVHLPIYEVGIDGSSSRVAVLHAVAPRGFVVESVSAGFPGGFYDDLPYFLDDLRPAGFLGRLVPLQLPELGLPTDIRDWTAEHSLKYLHLYGWDQVGNFIVGDEAYARFLRNVQNPPGLIDTGGRHREYPKRAYDILRTGVPGSSAAGEQPKFLAVRSTDLQPILVKFVLDTNSPAGLRRADLLVAEHVAHEVLERHGCPAAHSLLVRGDERSIFLEIERFDRVGNSGRRGLISLKALDAEFVGHPGSWAKAAAELHVAGQIDEMAVSRLRWIELFGKLIANSDMHLGNISFFVRGARCVELAPVYDMVPMRFYPRGELTEPGFREEPTALNLAAWTATAGPTYPGGNGPALTYSGPVVTYNGPAVGYEDWMPPTPMPADADIWPTALDAAVEFWNAVAVHAEISQPFKEIAQACASKVTKLRGLVNRLPSR